MVKELNLGLAKKKKKVIQSGIQILDFVVGASLNISLNSLRSDSHESSLYDIHMLSS